ncbi:hypothetical protein NDU88_005688 [Pleurodeles waltl]|uniref:Uncharacterized protein n=1 Tax=Pleurodeles waltl TaxID=8319 RepID=A0AAV7SMJ1_PLEWA|nr:hypothetical protein NDU88_005688 [Pleurodeles waltl]
MVGTRGCEGARKRGELGNAGTPANKSPDGDWIITVYARIKATSQDEYGGLALAHARWWGKGETVAQAGWPRFQLVHRLCTTLDGPPPARHSSITGSARPEAQLGGPSPWKNGGKPPPQGLRARTRPRPA